MPKEDNPVRDFVYWPNFELSPDGKQIEVGTGAGLDVQVTILNSLVQCIGQPMSEKCRWFKMKIHNLVAGSYIMFGLNEGCLSGVPEWNRALSIRYVSDTGGVFSEGVGYHSYIKYSTGDEIVCYIEQFYPEKCLVNFFKNGYLVFRHWAILPKSNIYATIGVKTGPVSLTVDWPKTGAPDFTFDTTALKHWIRVPQMLIDEDTKIFKLDKTDPTKMSYCAQAPRPLDKKSSYFEIEVKRITEDSGFGLGVTAACFDPYYAPGWGDEKTLPSYGYHGDDGAIRRNMSTCALVINEEWKCVVGDKIGCGVVFDDKPISTRPSTDQAVYIYATKNGKLLHVLGDIAPKGGYYPTIFLQSQGDQIKLKYPAAARMVDIDMENKIRVQRGLLSEFVRSYNVYLPNFENDGGEQVSFPDVNMEDPEERSITSIIAPFKTNNYFTVTVDELSSLNIGMVSFDSSMKESCLCGIICNSFGIRIKSDSDTSDQIVRRLDPGISITVLLRDIIEQTATIYFLAGEVQDMKVLGRTIMNLETPKIELFPTIIFDGVQRDMKVDWMQHEVPNFVIEDLETWILPVPQLHVEGKTISLSKDAEWCPVCVQSTMPLSKSGRCYFEVKLEESEYETFPGVGVCSLTTKTDAILGFERNVNTAAAFYPHKRTIHSGKASVLEKEFSSVKGDIIGCHVIFPDQKDNHSYALVKFYHNGQFVDNVVIQVQKTGLYASICFEYEGDAVSVNFDAPIPSVLETIQEVTQMIESQKERDRPIEREKTRIEKKTSFGHSSGAKGISPTINGRPIQLYVSHTNQDAHMACAIFCQLTSRGYLAETTAWNATLAAKKEKIEDCDAVVFCMSQFSHKSKDQETEVTNLVGAEKIIIPVVLENGIWPPTGKFKKYSKVFLKYELNVYEMYNERVDYDKLSMVVQDAVLFRRISKPKEEQIVSRAPVKTQTATPSTASPGVTQSQKTQKTAINKDNKTEKKSGVCQIL